MARSAPVGHAVRRALLLFGSGLFIDNLVFPRRQFPYFTCVDHVLVPGVLQKIAICYLAVKSQDIILV
jgi:predicted acyltransferase